MIPALYVSPTVPLGREIVAIVSMLGAAGLMVMLKLALAVCGVGFAASFTVIVACAVPAADCAGVPVMAPVELLIDNPLGRPVALNA